MADSQVQQEQQPVIAVKFKKRNKDSLIKKKQLRRTTTDDGVATTTKISKVVVNSNAADDEDGDNNNNEIVINQQSNYSSKDTTDNDKKEEDEEESGTLTAIHAIERRRKLLARSHGIDTKSLNKSKIMTHRNNDMYNNDEDGGLGGLSSMNDGPSTTGRLGTRTFGVGQLAGSNDMGGDGSNDRDGGGGGGGLLEKKHRLAMEEFIRTNLTVGKEQSGSDGSGNRWTMVSHQTSDAEKELYAELLLSSSVNNNVDREGDIDNKAGGEGDVGAGGAMMGGTGIAEVALPIDERLRVLKATEKAAMEYERARKARFEGKGREEWTSSMMSQIKNGMNDISDQQKIESIAAMVPMTFASGPGKRKRQNNSLAPPVIEDMTSLSQASSLGGGQGINDKYLIESSANIGGDGQYSSTYDVRKSDIAGVGASYSHNFQLHTKEWIMRKRDERQTEIDTIHAKQVEDAGPMTSESRARVGFDMARKIACGEMITTDGSVSSGNPPKKNDELTNEWDRKKSGTNSQSSDDRVWKSFMTNQRNRR